MRREGGREGRKEGRKEGGREGVKDVLWISFTLFVRFFKKYYMYVATVPKLTFFPSF